MAPGPATDGGPPNVGAFTVNDRRLGDRILYALNLALDQGELEVSELLARSLELALTRFGGPGVVDKRNPPNGFDAAYARLDKLRQDRMFDCEGTD